MGSAGLSASLDLAQSGQKKDHQTIPTPQTKGLWSKTSSGEYLYHTTWNNVELAGVNGSEARKPLAFSKALNSLAPKNQKTEDNLTFTWKGTEKVPPQFYYAFLPPGDWAETIMSGFPSITAFPVSFSGASAPTTYH